MAAHWLYPTIGAFFTAAVSLLLIFASGVGSGSYPITGAAVIFGAMIGWLGARREESLKALGACDPLTKLPNRRYFEDCLRRELAGAHRSHQPLALLVIDLDSLKPINDQLGHDVGDAAICLVAEALRGTCRASDLAARWGGDEFVVLAPQTNHEQAAALAQRICAEVQLQSAINSANARLHGQTSSPLLTASAGFAIASDEEPGNLWPATLFAAADKSMYRNKVARRSVPASAFADASRVLLTPDES